VKKLAILFAILFLMSLPAMAQTTPGTVAPTNWQPVAAVLAMAFASGLCGLAQGKAVAGAAEAMARNPGASAGIRFALILGLVLIESLALYTLVITFTTAG
jgi:F-type H+-transporting ATPase subunit c